MRNESVAPDFLMEVAKGMTPQEQTGRGIPKIVDLSTDEMLSFPKCFVTILSGTSSCRNPAKRSPKRMYGAIAILSCQSAWKKEMNSILNFFFKYSDIIINYD